MDRHFRVFVGSIVVVGKFSSEKLVLTYTHSVACHVTYIVARISASISLMHVSWMSESVALNSFIDSQLKYVKEA